jgi:Protein of unknown function (DUF3558)
VRSTALILVAVAGLLVTACSTTMSGTATPVPATGHPGPAGSSAARQNFGAPEVTTPLDVAKFLPDPCATLTTAQQQALGLHAKGKLDKSDLGNICDWSPAFDTVYAMGFNVKFDPGTALGLANAYQAAGPGGMRRLADVHGQPAATEPSQNTDGSCTIYLGATDQIEYAISVTIGEQEPNYRNPCPVAQQIADDTTATMKSGG